MKMYWLILSFTIWTVLTMFITIFNDIDQVVPPIDLRSTDINQDEYNFWLDILNVEELTKVVQYVVFITKILTFQIEGLHPFIVGFLDILLIGNIYAIVSLIRGGS